MSTAVCPAREIVLVDDDEIDAESFARRLRRIRNAPKLTVYRTGTEAVQGLQREAAPSWATYPPLIFLDLCLPGMTGLEVLQWIRQDERLKSAIVFVFTESRSESFRAAAYDWSIAGYILKSRVNNEESLLENLLSAFLDAVEFCYAE